MRIRTPFRGLVSTLVCLLATASLASAATISVPAGGDLQAALDAAQPGDVITLEPGATYVGNFVLRNKGAVNDFITVRSAAPDASLPPAGTRITPAFAQFLPKIKSANNMAAIRTATAAHHWKLQFLEFQANYMGYGEIISLGAGDSTQTMVSQAPYSLVLDRIYVHGDPLFGQKRGIALNGRDTDVLNSYVSDCKAIGQDAQAISGFNGPGNFRIENNYLEGATENVMFGGNDPGIAKLTPSDITVRRNHIAKQLAWRGGPWQIKNLFELKNAKRVLIEENVFQNKWSAAQEGWAFIFASINQGGTAWGQHSTVQDVTLRWNVVDNSYKGIVIAEGNGSASGVGYTPAARIAITDNRWNRIGDALFLVASQFVGATFARNTSTGPTRTILQIGAPEASARFPGFQFIANRAGPAKFALNSPRGDNAAMFAAYRIPVSSFSRNCIVRPPSDYTLNSNLLPGNTFVTMANLCWVNGGVDQGELGRRTSGVVVPP